MFKKLSKTHPEATKKTQKKANSMKKDSAEDIIIVDHLSKSFKLPTERSLIVSKVLRGIQNKKF